MELEIAGIDYFDHVLHVSEYVADYRDVPRFESLCRSCPNYGCRWGCPPFDDNPQPDLNVYNEVLLVLIKVNIKPSEARSQKEMIEAVRHLIQRVRPPFERKLLDIEKNSGGRAALFTGLCEHCGSADCSRIEGKPCRHPDLVRPSLEALGFDIQRTLADIFDARLLWVEDEKAPAYVCLVGAVFK